MEGKPTGGRAGLLLAPPFRPLAGNPPSLSRLRLLRVGREALCPHHLTGVEPVVLAEALVERGLPGKELEKGAGVALAAFSKPPSSRAVARG